MAVRHAQANWRRTCRPLWICLSDRSQAVWGPSSSFARSNCSCCSGKKGKSAKGKGSKQKKEHEEKSEAAPKEAKRTA